MYLETQPPGTRTCARHALNNVLQGSYASYEDFYNIYQTLCHSNTISSYYKTKLANSTNGIPHEGNHAFDNWSLTIPLQWLSLHGYFSNHLPALTSFLDPAFKNGQFLIYTQLGTHNCHHAVAVVDNVLYDSLCSQPIPIPGTDLKKYRIQKVWQVQKQ